MKMGFVSGLFGLLGAIALLLGMCLLNPLIFGLGLFWVVLSIVFEKRE